MYFLLIKVITIVGLTGLFWKEEKMMVHGVVFKCYYLLFAGLTCHFDT